MKTIKKSHLKEVFLKYGLSEGIFDIFNKKRKKLDKDLKDIRTDIEDTIKAAPNAREKKRLQDLSNAFRKAHAAGVKVY
jgi:hypothetical protein|tara:strand:- start:2007 stop:2243 length:237 start_codon:yes stop_codon:yes gene_type:complete